MASAAGRTVSSADSTIFIGLIVITSRRSLPEIIRETSSKSSIRRFCDSALRTMVLIAFAVVASSSFPFSRSRPQPKIEFKGARSSCETVARNSSRIRLAISASLRAAFSRLSNSSRSCSTDLLWVMSRQLPRIWMISPFSSKSGCPVQWFQRIVPSAAITRNSALKFLRSTSDFWNISSTVKKSSSWMRLNAFSREPSKSSAESPKNDKLSSSISALLVFGSNIQVPKLPASSAMRRRCSECSRCLICSCSASFFRDNSCVLSSTRFSKSWLATRVSSSAVRRCPTVR